MQPRRTLGLTSLVAITFFLVAGGAYGLEDAVGAGGPMLALLALLLVPWLWSVPTALMTAELSAAMPEDGGYVVWVERAFGRFWGFQEGWLSWLNNFADNALYPVMFVDYLAYLRGDMTPLERWLIGVAVVAVITWLNIRGIQLVGISSVIFALLVLAPFTVMIILGAPQVEPSTWLARSDEVQWGLLLSIILWNTSGWDNAGCCAGEVQNPNTTYPRVMAATVILVTLAYLLPVAVGVGVAALIPFSFQELVQVDMLLYAAALILEFAALIWLRLKEPEMPRPYRVPFGTIGVIALSVPPVALCVISVVLANTPTKLVSVGGIGVGLIVYLVISVRRESEK